MLWCCKISREFGTPSTYPYLYPIQQFFFSSYINSPELWSSFCRRQMKCCAAFQPNVCNWLWPQWYNFNDHWNPDEQWKKWPLVVYGLYVVDYIIQLYLGIIINYYKDPYLTTSIMESKRCLFHGSGTSKFSQAATRWAPTNYKLAYNPYRWPFWWATGVIILFLVVITVISYNPIQ